MSNAFVPATCFRKPMVSQNSNSNVGRLQLFALTERQMQFWEDVEEELDEMEKHGTDSQQIQRIRLFERR
jgi:hypothetical protein